MDFTPHLPLRQVDNLRFHDHEWPYYVAILGSAIAFTACAWVPRPWPVGPLRLVIAAFTFWMYGAGLLVDLADQNNSLGLVPVSIGVFGVGVVVFFGVLFLPRAGDQAGLSDSAMRQVARTSATIRLGTGRRARAADGCGLAYAITPLGRPNG